MIILTEVATKLENILNGIDSETSSLTNPTGFNFKVATEGLHLDAITNDERDGNFIPVFISSMGGQYNPVKGLKQGTFSIGVVFYYPVRFKDDFFTIGEFLVDAFVGSILNYGTISGKAVSNISVPQYGEIQDLDFKEFNEWVNQKYQKTIEKMEPYMSMQFTLFLTTAASGLIYGNDIKADFSFTYNNQTLTISDVKFNGGSLQSNAQAQSEQEEGTNESQGVPFGTTYGSGIVLYPNLETLANESTDNNPIYFYKELLKIWLEGNIQEVKCELSLTVANDNDLVYTRTCFIQSIVAPIEKGQLFTLTLSFARLVEEVENA